jgi:thiamine pyrophosphate-dependent acetolactate synthase large subunit-like protein
VLFVGNEAIRYDISDEVAAIADAIGALVMTASKIPVVFPNTQPNFAGQFLDDREIVRDIDTFWSIGAHMFKRGAKPKVPYFDSSTRIMHTGLDDGEVARNYPVDGSDCNRSQTLKRRIGTMRRSHCRDCSANWIGRWRRMPRLFPR